MKFEKKKILSTIAYTVGVSLVLYTFIYTAKQYTDYKEKLNKFKDKYNKEMKLQERQLDSLQNQIDSLINNNLRLSAEKKSGIKIPKKFGNKELKIVFDECKKYNLPVGLVIRLIYAESSFNYNALSHVGASGYMQIMPSTYKFIKRKLNINKDNKYTNLKAGIYYLKYLYNKWDGYGKYNRWRATILSYNYGIGRVKRNTDLFLGEKFNNYKYLRTIVR